MQTNKVYQGKINQPGVELFLPISLRGPLNALTKSKVSLQITLNSNILQHKINSNILLFVLTVLPMKALTCRFSKKEIKSVPSD